MAKRRTSPRGTRVKQGGVTYRSIFESKCAAALKKSGVTALYEPIKLPYQADPQTYTPDFVDADSGRIFESKGVWTSADRKKLVAVLEQHAIPFDMFVMIFQEPYKPLRKGSKQTYASWCNARGIRWTTLDRI